MYLDDRATCVTPHACFFFRFELELLTETTAAGTAIELDWYVTRKTKNKYQKKWRPHRRRNFRRRLLGFLLGHLSFLFLARVPGRLNSNLLGVGLLLKFVWLPSSWIVFLSMPPPVSWMDTDSDFSDSSDSPSDHLELLLGKV